MTRPDAAGRTGSGVRKPSAVVNALRRARALISKPESWIQGSYAVNAGHDGVASSSRAAVAWCSVGAIEATGVRMSTYVAAFHTLGAVIGSTHVASWNDSPDTTHADVLDAFGRAIELAEQDAISGPS